MKVIFLSILKMSLHTHDVLHMYVKVNKISPVIINNNRIYHSNRNIYTYITIQYTVYCDYLIIGL